MGVAYEYRCTDCGYVPPMVTEDFNFGMFGQVATPVVCPDHGIAWGDAGAMTSSWEPPPAKDLYPCSKCGRLSPRWDRRTCGRCGQPTMERNSRAYMLWD